MLPGSKEGDIAEVRDEGQGPPTENPLDISIRESHSMEDHACSYTKGVGPPSLDIFRIFNRVQMVDLGSQFVNEEIDLTRGDEFD